MGREERRIRSDFVNIVYLGRDHASVIISTLYQYLILLFS